LLQLCLLSSTIQSLNTLRYVVEPSDYLTILNRVLQRVRDGSLEWCIAEYEGKEKIKVTNSGSGNFDEFKVAHRACLPRQPASSCFTALSI
jgi:hypothetical protein